MCRYVHIMTHFMIKHSLILVSIGRMASLGYETQDAATYAEWGVDYLKVQCFTRFFLYFLATHESYPWMQ